MVSFAAKALVCVVNNPNNRSRQPFRTGEEEMYFMLQIVFMRSRGNRVNKKRGGGIKSDTQSTLLCFGKPGKNQMSGEKRDRLKPEYSSTEE